MAEYYDTRVPMSVDRACDWLRLMRSQCANAIDGSQIFTAADMAIDALRAQQKTEDFKRLWDMYGGEYGIAVAFAAKEELEHIKQGTKKNEPLTGWIRVRDRLPNKDGSYIVRSEFSNKVYTAHFWARSREWSGRNPYVTHWMPLPEPPKEAQV